MKNKYIYIYLFIALLVVNIGFAAINSITGEVNGLVNVTPQTGVFITDVNLKENDSSNFKINSFVKTTLDSNIILNNKDSFVTLNITVYNNSLYNYKFDQVLYGSEWYTNDNIEFILSGIKNNDLLLSKEYRSFEITFRFKDKNNIINKELNSIINFNFKKVYNITYINFENNNYPTEILENDSLNIKLNNTYDVIVKMNDKLLNINEYSYLNNNLIVNNVTGNLIIEKINWFSPVLNGNNYVIMNSNPPLPRNAIINSESWNNDKYKLNIGIVPPKRNTNPKFNIYNYSLEIKNTSKYDWINIEAIEPGGFGGNVTNSGNRIALKYLTPSVSTKVVKPGEILTINVELKYKLIKKFESFGKIYVKMNINGISKQMEICINYEPKK